MDFSLPPDVEDTRGRIARFVEAEILPVEADPSAYDAHENIRLDRLDALRAKAREQDSGPCACPASGAGRGSA